MVKVPADGAEEDEALEVAAAGDEVGDRVAVGDAGDVLLDDGAVVEHGSGVVAGGAYEFNTAGEGGVIGSCADKGGQEGVVDVNDRRGEALDELGAEDLHVAGEDDEVDLLVGE